MFTLYENRTVGLWVKGSKGCYSKLIISYFVYNGIGCTEWMSLGHLSYIVARLWDFYYLGIIILTFLIWSTFHQTVLDYYLSPHEIVLSKSAGLGIAIAGGTNRRGEGRIAITDMIPGGDCHKVIKAQVTFTCQSWCWTL